MQSAGTKLEEAQESTPAEAPRSVAEPVAASLTERDVRRKRPPALGFVLRMETLRKLARVTSLLVLDFVGVFMAIFTAQSIKAAIVSTLVLHSAYHETVRIVPFAYLVTALLFARSSLYADRAERPGLTRIVASLFQVTVVALIFALVNGEHFSSYYIFYGSLFFAVVYVGLLRSVYERATGRLLKEAGYRRRTVVVGSGKQIEAVAHALTDQRNGPIEVVGYMS
ncbi:MAG: hypothetical protein QOD76_1290, partial [Solirubrobacteraceae bacterium]|nr:hypothetical protein [Solirubrobacteraceae bacterium]